MVFIHQLSSSSETSSVITQRASLIDGDITFNDWCQFDSGPATITGSDVTAYVSVTRDGSVWLRLGASGGPAHFDWQMVDRKRPRVQTPVIDDEALNIIKSVPFLDYCVLTDVELRLTVQAGWNPSYLTFYDPLQAETRIVSLKVGIISFLFLKNLDTIVHSI